MARLKDAIRGHENIFQFWDRFLSFDKPTASLGLIGQEGVGKKKTAWAMIQQALCEQSPHVCGVCPSCLRVEHGHHESVLWIEPEKDQIRLEKAREVLDFLSLQSLSAERFVVVERAELLNPQSANSLLKMIEEPPVGTCFFLLTTNVTALLPTIRSRLIKLRFQPLTPEQLKDGKAMPEWILQASRGSFSRLAQLGNSKTQEFRRETAQLLLQLLTDPDFLMKLDWRDEVKDREFFKSLWNFWIEILRDTLCLQGQRKDLLLAPDQSEILKKLAAYPETQVQSWLQALVRTEADLSIPRDSQLVLEQFYVENRPRAEVN